MLIASFRPSTAVIQRAIVAPDSGNGKQCHLARSGETGRVDDNERRSAERVHRVFGTVFPDTTDDERTDEPPTRDAERDDWYRENRPPHHDDR